MVDVTDSIIVDLIARVDNYERNFDRATAAHGRFATSLNKLKGQSFDLGAEGQKYKQGASGIGQAEEALTTRVTRSRKARADAAIASDEREVASAKKAAAAKVDAEVSAQARIKKMIENSPGVNRRSSGTGGKTLGSLVPREQTGQSTIPAALLAGGASAEAAAATEVNHLLLDRFDLQQRLKTASGQEKAEIQQQIDLLRRLNTYRAAGLTEEEALQRAERETLVIEEGRFAALKKRLLAQTSQFGKFAEGAGLRRTGGSGAAVAGIATAATVAIGAEVITRAADYGRELTRVSEELGITTTQLQVFQAVARQAGVSNDQLNTGLGMLATSLGKAREGSQAQVKTFQALGINIKSVSTAGELLPILIDRLTKIKDSSQRAAIETALFGEAGRKLDGLLSGGNERVGELAQELLATGKALSQQEIKELNQTSEKIADLKTQLGVDISRIVAANANSIETFATSLANLTAKLIGLAQNGPAMALLGIFLGGRIAGLPGAVAGGIAGYNIGFDMQLARARSKDDANANPNVRYNRLRGVSSAIRYAQTLPQEGAFGYSRNDILKVLAGEGRRQISIAHELILDPNKPVQDGNPNAKKLANLLAPKPPKGPKGKSAETLKNEADERLLRHNDTVSRLLDQQETALAEQTTDEHKRADLKNAQIDRDLKHELEDLKTKSDKDVNNGENPKVAAQRLDEENKAATRAAVEKKNVVARDLYLEDLKAAYDVATQQLEIQQAILEDQQGIATTEKERRRIALALLDIDKKKESLGASYTIDRFNAGDVSISTSDKQGAQQTLATQDERYAGKTAATNVEHDGPLDRYRRQLHEATDDTNAALESVAVDGFGRLEDQLASTIGHVLGLKGAFGDLIASVLTDLAKIELEKGILQLIGGPKGDSGGSGGGFGGFFKNIIGAVAGHRATGGPVIPGGTYLVGEKGPEYVRFNGAAQVFPNGQLPPASGAQPGVSLNQTFHIDASGVNPHGYADGIIRQVRRETAQMIQASGKVILDQTPARVMRQQTLGT